MIATKKITLHKVSPLKKQWLAALIASSIMHFIGVVAVVVNLFLLDKEFVKSCQTVWAAEWTINPITALRNAILVPHLMSILALVAVGFVFFALVAVARIVLYYYLACKRRGTTLLLLILTLGPIMFGAQCYYQIAFFVQHDLWPLVGFMGVQVLLYVYYLVSSYKLYRLNALCRR